MEERAEIGLGGLDAETIARAAGIVDRSYRKAPIGCPRQDRRVAVAVDQLVPPSPLLSPCDP